MPSRFKPIAGKSTGGDPRTREPAAPRLPASFVPAAPADHRLADDASCHRMDFVDFDFADVSAQSVEFEECRFRNVDFSGASLTRAAFLDCDFAGGNLANLKATRSSMVRARLSGVRMAGLQWVDGGLRDVEIAESRADLSSFRFAIFRCVTFRGCNLTRADFTETDIGGVRFIDCDLTGAQFQHAKMVGTRFVHCALDGIGGVGNFNGATVTSSDLIALTHALAAGLSITIESPED